MPKNDSDAQIEDLIEKVSEVCKYDVGDRTIRKRQSAALDMIKNIKEEIFI